MKYFELLPFQNDDDLDEAIDIVDTLIDMEPLDRTEGEFLNELSDIVWEYEEIHCPMLGVFE